MKFYTYTGKMIEVTKPCKEGICAEDIAHSLSMICRAAGHFKHFYSVAQHSINAMREAQARGYSQRVCFASLLHDASESYLCDIPTPLKTELVEYRQIENKFEDEVLKRFNLYPLTEEEKLLVKEVDEAMLWYEFKHLHKIHIRFEKAPVLLSCPNVECMNMQAVEQLLLREIKGFEKLQKTA